MTDAPEAQRSVAALLATGLIGDAALREAGTVLEPIPVVDPGGALDSWFCPIAVEDKLAGFAQLLPDLTLMRYSSFERRPGDRTDLPDAATWTDPAAVRELAATAIRPDETLGDPVLSYDRSPARIAWKVAAVDAGGRSRTIYIAGSHVYEGSQEAGIGG